MIRGIACEQNFKVEGGRQVCVLVFELERKFFCKLGESWLYPRQPLFKSFKIAEEYCRCTEGGKVTAESVSTSLKLS